MNKNTDYLITATSFPAQVPSWTADTSGYSGSTTSGNGLVAQGSKTGALLAVRLSVTNVNFGSFTITVRLLLDGVVKVTGTPQTIGSTATANVDLSVNADVTSGQVLTVEAIASAASNLRINTGIGSYVRIT
ncbi:hypothetical protein [Nocardia sp. NPDC004860]|uniref:hypothetical protein n=1 Tax=Nocardia sp. NPDC004860 TaxID=3154557 RepID=UPI00339FF7AC